MVAKGFNEIAQVLGHETALKLCLSFGGVNAYISDKGAFKDDCVAAIGGNGWRKLYAVFKGGRVEIPMAYHQQNQARNQRIINDWRQGLTERELVMKYKITGRGIRYIKKKHRSICHG